MNIPCTMFKNDDYGNFVKPEDGKLQELGTPICRTITCKEPGLNVHHSNLVQHEIDRIEKQAIETMLENDCEHGDTINPFNKTVDKSGVSPTITTRPEGMKTAILPVIDTVHIKQATKEGTIECKVGGVADLTYPDSKTRRGRVQDGGDTSPAITAEGELCKIERYRIRKLTPRECWRLMGYTDTDFNKAQTVNSNTQLYKQAGNAIVKQCLMALFSQLHIKGVKPWNEVVK